MKRVLFVGYGGGHVRMLLPVARLLRERGLGEPVFLGLTTARAEVEAAGFACLGFADFLRADDAAALQQGRALAAKLPAHAISFEESAAYLGLSYADLVREHGEQGAAALYAQHGRQAFLPVPTLERILTKVQPDLLVATSAPRAERASFLAARRLGVPAVCLVDLFAAYEIEWLREPGFADRICVLNERVRDRLVATGRRAEEVIVTGNPAFDGLLDPGVRERGAALRKARGWDGRRVWLWASQVEPESHPCQPGRGDTLLPRRIAQELQRITRARPDMELVIRPHPSEGDYRIELGAREWLSPRTENLHELLHACDGAVVLTSTVGLEASIAGCAVVQVTGSLYTLDAPYLAYGIADAAVALEGLAVALDAAPPRRAAVDLAPAAPRVLEALARWL
ncbi:UDP-glycosyltransferase [Ramlibacter henchirensis]|uniref:UDP-glycosyltransferase n=1 Tax=Ramlibacter henchirensis TaxID=204072 RepID=A0A4Z0BVP1_9BURK|nr:UDP-glycosyltransferase [Ramlibacter henchirensis]TFZ02440.1 UDP-glycosyltransferase [Ramlibacter henchirensis]